MSGTEGHSWLLHPPILYAIFSMEAIALRLEAIAFRMEAIAITQKNDGLEDGWRKPLLPLPCHQTPHSMT